MNAPNSCIPVAAASSTAEIVQTLKRIITEDLNVEVTVDRLDENLPLLEGGLALDSVVLVEMINAIEMRLGIEFLDTDLRTRSFKNLKTLAEVVRSRMPCTGEAPPGG